MDELYRDQRRLLEAIAELGGPRLRALGGTWDRVMAINLKSVFLVTQAVVGRMRQRK